MKTTSRVFFTRPQLRQKPQRQLWQITSKLLKSKENGNQIKFNAATFVDLGYPEYIQLFVEEKGKQFAIKACKADAPQAIKFSKPAGEQRYPIKISCAPAANAVRRVMQWALEESWNVPGAIFGEEKVIIYSLEQAYAPVPKGGWTAKKQAAAAAEAASKVNAK